MGTTKGYTRRRPLNSDRNRTSLQSCRKLRYTRCFNPGNSMPPLIISTGQFQFETRRRHKIVTHFTRESPLGGAFEQEEEISKRYPRSIRRNVGPSNTYNCHALTFNARRASIVDSIKLILEHDDYHEVGSRQLGIANVLPGDIVVYYSSGRNGNIAGDVEHSGIVIKISRPATITEVWVLSKWGYGDERIHVAWESPYDPGDIRYYRINDCPRNQVAGPYNGAKRLFSGQ